MLSDLLEWTYLITYCSTQRERCKVSMKRINFLLIIILIGSPSFVSSNEEYSFPEEVVSQYLSFYKNAKFAQSATLLHPDLLLQYKEEILDIISTVKKDKRTALVNSYGFGSIAEMEKISRQEFYSLMVRNRLKITNQESLDHYVEYAKKVHHNIGTKEITVNGCFKLPVNSIVLNNNETHRKDQLFVLCRNEGKYKIVNISVTN